VTATLPGARADAGTPAATARPLDPLVSSALGQGGAAVGPALPGDLARFVATDVIQFLRFAGATGRLEFDRHGERVTLAFAGGRPEWATTSGRAVRLGDVLVHRGAIRRDTLEAAIADDAEPGPVGAIARRRGASAEQVDAAVCEVFRRIVCLLALWPDGTFRFVPGAAGVVDDAGLDLELDRVLLESLNQADLALDA
jgi:hypothetical protein